MYLVRTSKNFLDVRSRIMIYNAHIQSHVIYCLSTWGNMCSTQQKLLVNRLLKRCINLITGTGRTNVNVFDFYELILFENYKFGYKSTHNQLPEKILHCAQTDHNGKNLMKTHRYSTHSKAIPNMPKVSTSKYSKSIFCCGL